MKSDITPPAEAGVYCLSAAFAGAHRPAKPAFPARSAGPHLLQRAFARSTVSERRRPAGWPGGVPAALASRKTGGEDADGPAAETAAFRIRHATYGRR